VTDLLDKTVERAANNRADAPGNAASSSPHRSLTQNQLLVWAGQKLHPDAPIYSVPKVISLKGEIDPHHFSAAFFRLIQACDAFRTVFEELDGVPCQRVLTHVPRATEFIDLSSAADPAGEFQRHISARSGKALALTQCAYDSALFKLGPAEFKWYACQHHLIVDGTSTALFFRHLGRLYERSLAGKLHEPFSLPSFQDYAAEERAYLNSDEGRAGAAYWKSRLCESSEMFSYFRSRNLQPSTLTTKFSRDLGQDRSEELKQLARSAPFFTGSVNVSVFNLAATAILAWQHRISGNRLVTLGAPQHNRRTDAQRQTIGLLMHALPLRVEVGEEETLCSLAARTAQSSLECLQHGRVLPEAQGRQGHFDVVFNYLNTTFPDFAGIPAQFDWLHAGHSLHGLLLNLHDFGTTGSFRLDAELNHTLFAPGDEARVFDQLLRILDAFIENPHQKISEIDLSSSEERVCLLNELSGALTSPPSPQSNSLLHELFEARVAGTPGKTALVHGESSLSYAALNEQAEALAQRLRAAGAGPGSIVGACHERSPGLVVALLGVLKSGAAYLPLDATQPDERLGFMLGDAKVAHVVTQAHLAPRLRQITSHAELQPCFIELDHLVEDRGSPSITPDPVAAARPDSPAYVIYTSGSSGTPKGVVVPHRAVVNFVHAANVAYGWNAEDRVLQFASIGFDTSVEEIFLTLSAGGTLMLRTEDMVDTTRRFLELCREWGISVLDLPTAFWHEMTTQMAAESLSLPEGVRQVVLGGERALPGILAQWRKLVGDRVRLLNTYGPTEATVASTVADLTNFSEAGELPIGRPLPGVQVYVLDPHLQLAPRGVVGELFIGGAGLALGYFGQPELTAHHFVADPFHPGARLYRTGDLVRWRDDGQLKFFRRADSQMKIRGHRIEPKEIEFSIRRHPAVRQAVVQLREDLSHSPRLVAYVTCDKSGQPNPAELRSFLRTTLPEYMIPAAFIHLQSIPVNRNGKVDHARLPSPAEAESAGHSPAPRPGTETQLADIYREILDLRAVGVNDSLFDLGGHSLLATRVLSQIRSRLGVELSLRELFENPSVATLAVRIDAARAEDLSTNSHPRPAKLRKVSRAEPIPLSFAQKRLWFLERLEPGLPTYVLPASVRLRGALDLNSFRRALDEVARRHESLRTTFAARDGQPYQLIHEPHSVPLFFEDLSPLDEEARARTVREREASEASSPFDLDHGPLLRARLLRTATDEHLLLLTTHHIISDGWTTGVLLRELLTLHDAFRRNASSPLPEPVWQYADFAAWQHEEMQGDRLRRQLDYWREQLHGASPVLELPTDFSRPAVQRFHGSEETLLLPRELSAALRALGAKEGTTLFMTLLAGFQTLLARLSGQDDFLVGCAIAGRTFAETETMAGLFVNTLVLRARTEGQPTVREFLARVRNFCLGAYEHQEMPFEKLVEELNPPRDLSRTPLFQVFFNMLNLEPPPAEAHGLRLDGLRTPAGDSKFDLTLYVRRLAEGDELRLVYNTQLYRAERMKEFLGQYQRLLELFVAHPEKQLDALPLITANAAAVLPDPKLPLMPRWEGSIVDQFQRQAAVTPEALAITGAGLAWSYKKLDEQSNQLAQHLLANGIQRGDIVAVYARRHPALALAILGVLKAGAANLMLGAANPPELLLKLARVAGPRAWVVMGELDELPESLAAATRASTCCVPLPETNFDTTVFGTASATRPELQIRPEDVATVTFTSGTTGEPKAVVGTHQPLAHFFSWQRKTFGFGAADRFSVLSGLGHDPLVRNIFAALTSGGAVCVPEEETMHSPNSLLSWMRTEGITVAHLTPAHGQLLAAATSSSAETALPTLRLAFFGGDKLRRRDVAVLEKLAPSARCVNFYGTTETPQAMSWHEVERREAAPTALEVVPIGRGIEAVQLLIVNRAGQLAGIGECGEIVVRTPCLARGYLGDEALTEQRFAPNPFGATDASDRIYRTGDQGRYRLDGSVEIMGRADRQVKVRGFRIEPAEVEARLAEHPQVQRAVVAARPGPDNESQLIAWYVPRTAPVEASVLRDFLRDRLPGPVVTGAIIAVETIPLTANGKIDWQALSPQDREAGEIHAEAGPSDALEFQLVRLWAEALGRASVKVEENFFDLGGHSLLAVKLFARVEVVLGRALPLATLFQAPTVRRLAEVLRREGWTPPWSSLVAIQPRGHRVPLFCVHGVGGNVLGFRDLARHLGPDQPVFGLQSVGLDGKRSPLTSFEEMAAHYVSEIRQLQPQGPYCIAGLSVGGLIAYEMARHLMIQGQEVATLALFDTGSRGQLEALTPADARRRRRSMLAARIRYNWKKQFAGVGIAQYWRRKLRTWRRRWKSIRQRRNYINAARNGQALPNGILSVRDANYLASNHYLPKDFAGKVTLFRVNEERVGRPEEPTLGWQRLARGGVEVIEVPGTHTSLILEPHVQTLAKELKAAMERSLQAGTSR
jgi:amino acid adenylation domain-containing protein